MPLNLTTLAGKLATTNVAFMGQSTKVVYDPMVLTQENLTKAQAGNDDEFTEFFCELVKSWDVQRSAKKIPLNPKAVNGVPLTLLKAIFMTIMKEAGTDEEGKASNDG